MRKIIYEAGLASTLTPEEKREFVFNSFNARAIISILENNLPRASEVGVAWHDKTCKLIECSVLLFDLKRNSGATSGSGFNAYSECVKFDIIKKSSTPKGEYYLPQAKAYLKEIEEKHHTHLETILEACLDSLMRSFENAKKAEQPRSLRTGDVIAEGPGFEVFVGPKMTNFVRYSEGKNGIILMHDPRDGHFLLVERYSNVDGGYVLEFPKARSASMLSKETRAAVALREQTGLSLRDLEKIGEIKPDTHLLSGVCEVFYGEFDLEENFTHNSKLVRDVKRINEEGLYQAALDGSITCAQTLSAISIWRAFEYVRKKRVANSRRVRNPKVVEDLEVDAEADDE